MYEITFKHDYCRTISLTIWTIVSKLISLLFNVLFRFIIVFLAMNKCLLISWQQSQSVVILEPKKIKSITASNFSPSICCEVMELNAVISVDGFSGIPLLSLYMGLLGDIVVKNPPAMQRV